MPIACDVPKLVWTIWGPKGERVRIQDEDCHACVLSFEFCNGLRANMSCGSVYALQNYGGAYVDTYEIAALACQEVK